MTDAPPWVMESIGNLIKEELERQERTVTWFARKLSCDRSNIYRLFQKHSIDTALLQRISIILNKDFFAELSKNIQGKDWTLIIKSGISPCFIRAHHLVEDLSTG